MSTVIRSWQFRMEPRRRASCGFPSTSASKRCWKRTHQGSANPPMARLPEIGFTRSRTAAGATTTTKASRNLEARRSCQRSGRWHFVDNDGMSFCRFLVAAACAAVFCYAADHPSKEAVDRGQKLFVQSCGFCHGNDATGSRAPDLVRAPSVNHDENGNAIGPIIRSGRPDKGMPGFPLSDAQIADIAAFLQSRVLAALHSSSVGGDYPLQKLLTGSAAAGKAFFEGAGGCTGCHSVTGDL